MLAPLALVAFGLSLLVQTQVVPLHSNNLDEGVYVFQARMFREGMLTLPVETHGEHFRPWLSGERDGRIFLEFQVGFPAFLAVAESVLGSFRLALAGVAALTVVFVHGLASALFGDRRTALVAAGLVSLSPLFVLHSGLVLTYSLTVALIAGAAWAMLAAVARRSWRVAVVAGLLAGAAGTVRPFDVLLVLGPFALLALHRSRHRARRAPGRDATAMAGAFALVALPFLVLLIWYNLRTTGRALEFPNMAADPLNRFGFGTRRLVETEPTIEYGRLDALGALWDNVRAVPSWLLGGPLLVAAAFVGALRKGRAPERWTLVAVALAFPVGYSFWWATTLSAVNATNGIGPHYYVPAFVALGILAARGLAVVVPRTGRVVIASVLVLVAVTAWAIPDKLAVQRQDTARNRAVERLEPTGLTDAVVVVDYVTTPYLLSRYSFHRPDPTLRADVLYAAERGHLTPGLVERFPDRDLYRLREELRPGDELGHPTGTFRRLSRRAGAELVLEVAPRALPPGRHARAYVVVDGTTHRVDLGVTGETGGLGAAWRLTRTPDPADGRGLEVRAGGPVLAGIEISTEPDFGESERLEVELGVQVVGDELRTLVPGRGWFHARFPGSPDPHQLVYDVDTLVEVSVVSRPARAR